MNIVDKTDIKKFYLHNRKGKSYYETADITPNKDNGISNKTTYTAKFNFNLNLDKSSSTFKLLILL